MHGRPPLFPTASGLLITKLPYSKHEYEAEWLSGWWCWKGREGWPTCVHVELTLFTQFTLFALRTVCRQIRQWVVPCGAIKHILKEESFSSGCFVCLEVVLLFRAALVLLICYLITRVWRNMVHHDPWPLCFLQMNHVAKYQTCVITLSGLPVLPVEWDWRHLKIHTLSAIISVSVDLVYYCRTDFTIHSIINTPRCIKQSIEFWTSKTHKDAFGSWCHS